MRFVNLIVILQAILAQADPSIQPRDLDFGGDLGFGTGFDAVSFPEDLAYTPTNDAVNLADAFTGGGSVDIAGFADLNTNFDFGQDAGSGLNGFSAESLDLANLIPADSTFAPADNPADVFAAEPEGPAIVADVPITGLGVTDGDLIASADTLSNSIQIAGFLPGSENIPPFTPGPGTQDILNAADNPSFSTSSAPVAVDPAPGSSDSSLDNLSFTNVGFVAPPEGTEPFTPSPEILDIVNAAENNPSFSTSDSPIAIGSTIDLSGSSASSSGGLQFADVGFVAPPEGVNQFTPGPGTEDFLNPAENPFSGTPDTVASAIDGTPFSLASANDLNLGTFKATTEKLATDVKLPPEMQEYFDRITKAPLTQDDWRIVSGATANAQQLSLPARQALQGITVSPQTQQRLQSNSGFDLAGIGSNFLKALITVAQTAVQKAIIQNNDQEAVVQRVPVLVTQLRPVAVPITVTLVRGVRVPVTVISTLPGGVVTRIIILPPASATPSTLLTSPSGIGVAKAITTPTPSQSNTTPSPPVQPIAAPAA